MESKALIVFILFNGDFFCFFLGFSLSPALVVVSFCKHKQIGSSKITEQKSSCALSAKVITIKLQSLRRQFETVGVKNNETIQEFLVQVLSTVSQMCAFGEKLKQRS